MERKLDLSYNILYQCHYKDYKNNQSLIETEEFKSFSKEDEYFLEKKIYQDDLLSIFGIDRESEFQDETINPIIRDLYIILEKQEDFKSLMNQLGEGDLEMGLMIMFSMDLLFVSHPCFCEFLQTGQISSIKIDLLKREIQRVFDSHSSFI
jgi:hypothetical protein